MPDGTGTPGPPVGPWGGVSYAVEDDEASGPVQGGLLGADAVAPQADLVPDLVEQFRPVVHISLESCLD